MAAVDRKPKAQTNKNPIPKPRRLRSATSDFPASANGEPCMVYDLTGSMEIRLPPQWRTVIGNLTFEECLADLRSKTMTIVSREPGVVVYVRLSPTFTEMEQGTI